MIRSILATLALFLSFSSVYATGVDPVVAQMTIDTSVGRGSYWFEWRGSWGDGTMTLKWVNYDPAIHSAGYSLQNARITILSKPALPGGCRFELLNSKIKANGLNSTLGFRVRGVSCKDALQELAKGDFALEFYHVPELNSSTAAIVPQLNLTIEGH